VVVHVPDTPLAGIFIFQYRLYSGGAVADISLDFDQLTSARSLPDESFHVVSSNVKLSVVLYLTPVVAAFVVILAEPTPSQFILLSYKDSLMFRSRLTFPVILIVVVI